MHCCGAEEPSRFTVVGDTHGQYFDMMNLLSDKVAGFPSPLIHISSMVTWLTDAYSFEAIALLAIKIASPSSVEILRDHETRI